MFTEGRGTTPGWRQSAFSQAAARHWPATPRLEQAGAPGYRVSTSVAALCCTQTRSAGAETMMSSLADTGTTRLAVAIAPQAASHPGKSGIHALPDPGDAFAVRMALAAAADRTLDVQYYIWDGDESGMLLLEALWQAAERGVRIRLLFDDSGTSGLDGIIATLDAHPNIEVRALQSPVSPLVQADQLRHGLPAGEPADAQQVVHCRRPGVDRRRTKCRERVLRGGQRHRLLRPGRDRDGSGGPGCVEGVRPVLEQPVGLPGGPDREACANRRDRVARGPVPSGALRPGIGGLARPGEGVRDGSRRARGEAPFEWTRALLLCDDPAKTLNATEDKDTLLLTQMFQAVGHPAVSFDLVSPYLVPGKQGTAAFTALAGRGVKVRILTNSLMATDVSAVHAGYSKRRGDLLDGGVRLFELERSAIDERRGAMPSASRSLVCEPARQDLRGGQDPHLRRLLQLRRAIRPPEHRDGAAHRQPLPCGAALRGLRRWLPRNGLRGPPRARGRPGVDGSRPVRRAAVHDRAGSQLPQASLGAIPFDPPDRVDAVGFARMKIAPRQSSTFVTVLPVTVATAGVEPSRLSRRPLLLERTKCLRMNAPGKGDDIEIHMRT
ncbi:MAG: hypothetical protein M0C28_30905 [Candidatus Moduliflexus flocculans]|nr:hypothetical protein [Candidatus Moduliflexus flocculans]